MDLPDSLCVRGTAGTAPRGRSLHVTRAFAPGALIATLTPPLLLPPRAHATHACGYCLQTASSHCNGCRAVAYCGAACQRADWARVHGRECRVLRRVPGLRDGGLPATTRALVQALVAPAVRAALAVLEGHEPRTRADDARWAGLRAQAQAALAYSAAGNDGDGAAAELDAVALLCRIQMNAFDRSDDDTGLIGMFIEPVLAMANHSCIPNAVVQCTGRKVFLRAETNIAAGDEVEISYIGLPADTAVLRNPTDCTLPLESRRKALASYYFRCSCARCAGDLSVYHVRDISPNIKLNQISLAASLPAPASPSAMRHTAVASRHLGLASSLFAEFQADSAPSQQTVSQRRGRLSQWFPRCRPLVEESMWALQPLPQLVTEAVVFYSLAENFDCALAAAALSATQCAPVQFVAPFHSTRIKGCMALARLLSNTAAESHARAAGVADARSLRPLIEDGSLRLGIQHILDTTDQVSSCELLLHLIRRYGPMGHSEEWEVCREAAVMLQDIEQLPGREKERSLIRAWNQKPADPACHEFFEYCILKPIEALAAAAIRLLTTDFVRV